MPDKPIQPPGRQNADKGAENAISFLKSALTGYRPRDFAIRLWNGSGIGSEHGDKPRFTMIINNPDALRGMFLRPNQITLGEAFIRKDFDIEGDLVAACEFGDFLMASRWGLLDKIRLGRRLLALPASRPEKSGNDAVHLTGSRHSKKRDSQAVTHHYNVSNNFYRLWLDERMVYSCAYFASSTDPLDAAQKRKLDYICRKLRLKKGDRLLDLGCGWGGLVLHAARNYGVEAVGITLSRPQEELARERIRAAGLKDRCRVEVKDYRELNGAESFDKIVSVGMFEHVGEARLGEYFARAFRLLKPEGVFLNHGIAAGQGYDSNDDTSFIDAYVFPDGEILPINTTLRAAETAGFEVRDLESLREHYALTLRHWVKRLEAATAEAISAVGEDTFRIWRLYMAGSAHGFDCGRLNVYQALLVKPDKGKSGQPLTRTDWYA